MTAANIKPMCGWILGILAVVISYSMPPTELLSHEALFAIGMLVAGCFWMMFGCLPDYAAMLTMCTGWILAGCVPFNVAFSAFSGSTIWIIIAAMYFGAAAAETNLLIRITYGFMKLFSPTFKGLALCLVMLGIVISPLIPSFTAKILICVPISKMISQELGYADNSKGATGIFSAFMLGFYLMSPAFLSASTTSYALVGLQPQGQQADWMQWFLWALPWTIVVAVLMFLVVLVMFKPEATAPLEKETVNQRYADLGPWTWQQKVTLGVLVAILLMLMTERMHGISATIVAIMGALFLTVIRILGKKQIKESVVWDQVVFIGCILAISTVFAKLGINEAIRSTLGPVLKPLLSNIWLFIPVYILTIYAARLVIVSLVACCTIFSVIFLPLAESVGMHSFIIIFISYVSVFTWYVPYHNGLFSASMAMVKGTMGSFGQMAKFSSVFMVVNIIACLACVPIWKMLSML